MNRWHDATKQVQSHISSQFAGHFYIHVYESCLLPAYYGSYYTEEPSQTRPHLAIVIKKDVTKSKCREQRRQDQNAHFQLSNLSFRNTCGQRADERRLQAACNYVPINLVFLGSRTNLPQMYSDETPGEDTEHR